MDPAEKYVFAHAIQQNIRFKKIFTVKRPYIEDANGNKIAIDDFEFKPKSFTLLAPSHQEAFMSFLRENNIEPTAEKAEEYMKTLLLTEEAIY